MYTYHIHLHHLHPPVYSTPGLQLVWPDAFQLRWSSKETTMWGPTVITTKCNHPWLSCFWWCQKKGPIIFKSALLIWVPSWIMWNTLRIINKISCMHWDCTHFWFQFHITINNFQPPRGGFFFVFCFFGPMGKNPKKSLEGFEVATFELIESPSAPDPAWNIRGKSYQASAFWSRSPGLGNLWDNSAYWIYRCYKYLVPKQVSIVP